MTKEKIVTIVGARPQFIKMAVVSEELKKHFNEIVIHTGQHYDHNMSAIFFEELNIPEAKYNLGVSGGSHGQMTGEMLIKIEEVLMKEEPSMVLLYGDTNSTLAGALSAAKLQIPICHVEAGVRFGTLHNPEEINRITTDHVSSLLLCCTESAITSLAKEGKTEEDGVHLVGDPMYDAFLKYAKQVQGEAPEKLKDFAGQEVPLPESFYYMTCHRQENTQDIKNLQGILDAMESLEYPTIYPVHPRNQKMVAEIASNYENVLFVQPVGYLMSIYLVLNSTKIVTDSGGLQREAFFAQKQCVTIFDHIVWQETMHNKVNQLAKPDQLDILEKLSTPVEFEEGYKPFGNGESASEIAERMLNFFD